MVLGWRKKNVTKQDEEDMTMDEILASIRRYVTEDQNATREAQISKQPLSTQEEESQLDTARSHQPEQSSESMMDYNEPYGSVKGQHETSESVAEAIRAVYEEEEKLRQHETSHHPHHHHHHHDHHDHHHHDHMEKGVASEAAISAAAMALSRLEEVKIKSEQQALDAMGNLTLDTLITNLARPMIKEWLEQHLPQIVATMVEREIERIRNHR